jgi:hypothetical protein
MVPLPDPWNPCPGIDGLRFIRKIPPPGKVPPTGKILSPGVPLAGRTCLGVKGLPGPVGIPVKGLPGPGRIPVPAALASVRRMQSGRNRDGRIRSCRRRAAPCKRKRFLGRTENSGRENSGGFSALALPAPPAFRTRRQTGNRTRAGPAGDPIAISRPLFPAGGGGSFPETVTEGAGHYRIIIGHSGTRGFPFG